MPSRPASSASADSLYAPPSPRTLRRAVRMAPVSHYTSLCDVPPLNLDGATNPMSHRGPPLCTKTPLPPSPPSHGRHRPTESTRPLPDPVPKDTIRVVYTDSSPLVVRSSTQMDTKSRPRLEENSGIPTLDYQHPLAEKKYEQSRGSPQVNVSEKRKLNTDVPDATNTIFWVDRSRTSTGVPPTPIKSWCSTHYTYDTCPAGVESRKTCKYPSSQCPTLHAQPPSSPPAFPPPGRVWAGPVRLPSCHSCRQNWHTRHLHDVEEERIYRETLARKEQENMRVRAEQDRLRRQTQSTWCWPRERAARGPCVVRSPTTTWIEDVAKVSDMAGSLHIPSNPPAHFADQEREGSRLRLQGEMELAAAQGQAREDAQWDSVDLSDEDEWDQVAADEVAEWEVLER